MIIHGINIQILDFESKVPPEFSNIIQNNIKKKIKTELAKLISKQSSDFCTEMKAQNINVLDTSHNYTYWKKIIILQ
jgi:hypothetical protein